MDYSKTQLMCLVGASQWLGHCLGLSLPGCYHHSACNQRVNLHRSLDLSVPRISLTLQYISASPYTMQLGTSNNWQNGLQAVGNKNVVLLSDFSWNLGCFLSYLNLFLY